MRAAFRNGVVGAHQTGEEILHLAFARIASADAHALAGRRRINVEPGLGRKLGDRVEVGHVDPVGTPIIRHAERARIGDAAPADTARRLDQDKAPPRRGQTARSGDAGGTGTHDDDVDAG